MIQIDKYVFLSLIHSCMANENKEQLVNHLIFLLRLWRYANYLKIPENLHFVTDYIAIC